MTAISYSRLALCREYALAASGFVLAAGPLVFLDPAPFAAWPMGAAAVVFGVYGLATVRRHLTRISFDDREIRVHAPWPGTLAWDEAREIRLRHFSTRRDGAGGWMTLVLRGTSARITVESSLEHFPALAERAARAARDNGLSLDRSSAQNFRHLGLAVPETAP